MNAWISTAIHIADEPAISHDVGEYGDSGRITTACIGTIGRYERDIMRIIDLRGKNLSRAELLAAMPRAAMGTSEATDLGAAYS